MDLGSYGFPAEQMGATIAAETIDDPIFVLADEVLTRSERLFAAISWREFATLPRPILVLAVEVLVSSERLLLGCRYEDEAMV